MLLNGCCPPAKVESASTIVGGRIPNPNISLPVLFNCRPKFFFFLPFFLPFVVRRPVNKHRVESRTNHRCIICWFSLAPFKLPSVSLVLVVYSTYPPPSGHRRTDMIKGFPAKKRVLLIVAPLCPIIICTHTHKPLIGFNVFFFFISFSLSILVFYYFFMVISFGLMCTFMMRVPATNLHDTRIIRFLSSYS